MSDDQTTAVVHRYLDELEGDSPSEPLVRDLLDRAVRRLHLVCATLLHRGYPRLTQLPLNLALASQRMRWELNDLARRLDEQPVAVGLREGLVPAPAGSASGLTPDGVRMLQAIGELPGGDRGVFGPVRIQGLTRAEAAQSLGVSAVTVKRRWNGGPWLLSGRLTDPRPGAKPPGSI
jgi:RNA polymerase sigma-70 factor (ECF subfamily)